ncbi:hypothetical protein M153_29350001863, partial [Pseudoloma neurophilia]
AFKDAICSRNNAINDMVDVSEAMINALKKLNNVYDAINDPTINVTENANVDEVTSN